MSAGLTTVEFVVEADGASEALHSALTTLREVLPSVRVLRLDRDLVSMADIAFRIGRSNESVRLLVTGKRGPGRFPQPLGILKGGTRVWEWAPSSARCRHDGSRQLGVTRFAGTLLSRGEHYVLHRRSR